MAQSLATTSSSSNQALEALPIEQALEVYAPNFAAVLPPDIPLDHFKRIVVTAININPELRTADRRSLLNSCVKCASDGLLPDGRDAALVVFNTKVKTRQGGKEVEKWMPLVQYMPMIFGIRKRMRNSGEVKTATAETVHRNDSFEYELGDTPFIKHVPPPLGEDRGELIGCYARIELANGEVLRDVMSVADVERARAQSKAPNSLMWAKFYSEGAKKTVLRRCGKQAPASSTLHRLLNRDDEALDLPPPGQRQLIPPRPIESDYDSETGEIIDEQQGEDAGDSFAEDTSEAIVEIEPPKAAGREFDWQGYANMIRGAYAELPPPRRQEFRNAQARYMVLLRSGHRDISTELNMQLAEIDESVAE